MNAAAAYIAHDPPRRQRLGPRPDRAHDGARRDEQQRGRLPPHVAVAGSDRACSAKPNTTRRCAFNGWLDSTLDLRDGLSVVEVFAPIDEPAALQEFALLRR